MPELKRAAEEFLARDHRIAVVGVAREEALPPNAIYRKLRAQGYTVYAVNPHTDEIEGDACYRSLAAIAGEVDGVVVGAPAAAALEIVQECVRLGIKRVWLHRGIGAGSVSAEAVAYGAAHGITVIPGACPMMYLAPVDFGHRCMCWVMSRLGKLPEPLNG